MKFFSKVDYLLGMTVGNTSSRAKVSVHFTSLTATCNKRIQNNKKKTKSYEMTICSDTTKCATILSVNRNSYPANIIQYTALPTAIQSLNKVTIGIRTALQSLQSNRCLSNSAYKIYTKMFYQASVRYKFLGDMGFKARQIVISRSPIRSKRPEYTSSYSQLE